jgi:hypothetical protein
MVTVPVAYVYPTLPSSCPAIGSLATPSTRIYLGVLDTVNVTFVPLIVPTGFSVPPDVDTTVTSASLPSPTGVTVALVKLSV